MATLERQTHRVGASLEVGEVEALLVSLEEHRHAPCAWHLDFSATRHVQPLAGARLAAAMRALASENLSVTLPSNQGTQRFRVLYRTGLLGAIAAHANDVEGEDDLLTKVIEDPRTYSTTTNLIVFNRVDGVLTVNKDRFASRLWSELARHLSGAQHGLSKTTRSALVEVGYEGIANIIDHAYAAPFEGDHDHRSALFLLTWHKEIRASPSDRLGLGSYIERAHKEFGDSMSWIALAIIDDGNGIPARQALDSEVYTGSPIAEEDALATALEKGASVKLAASDAALRGDPGWGLELIARAVVGAGGYGCLRSGREIVEVSAFAPGLDWTLHPDRLAPLRGTVLEFVLPVENPQGSLL